MKLLATLRRIRTTHVIAFFLFLIWVELGGPGRVESIAHYLFNAVKHIGGSEEGPAPLTEEQIKWQEEFERARYGPPATAPSSP